MRLIPTLKGGVFENKDLKIPESVKGIVSDGAYGVKAFAAISGDYLSKFAETTREYKLPLVVSVGECTLIYLAAEGTYIVRDWLVHSYSLPLGDVNPQFEFWSKMGVAGVAALLGLGQGYKVKEVQDTSAINSKNPL